MVSAEASLRELGIQLPQAPTHFGAYVEAIQTGDLLFLSAAWPGFTPAKAIVSAGLRLKSIFTLPGGRVVSAGAAAT